MLLFEFVELPVICHVAILAVFAVLSPVKPYGLGTIWCRQSHIGLCSHFQCLPIMTHQRHHHLLPDDHFQVKKWSFDNQDIFHAEQMQCDGRNHSFSHEC